MERKYQRWDEYLIAEHEMIERAMAVLKERLDDLDATAKNPVQMVRALDFLLEFGDKIHNAKEEKHLFPLMQQRGIPAEGGPIGVMLMEHEMERELLVRMVAAAPKLAEMDGDERDKYRAEGMKYLEVRAEHIWKENDILYPMARRVMSDADADGLLDAFYAIDQAAYGDSAHEKFARMVDEVEKVLKEKKGLIHNLSYEQIEGIMETLPFEVTFVDADDTVAYFNRLDKEKIFPRTRSVIGRKVEKCHPEKSVDTVREIVTGFKNRTRDKAEFWIDFMGDKVLIRYYPVYNDEGEYLGVLEVTQAIGEIQKITGQKRLLD